MVITVLRGISRITASMTGLILVYGISFAMEGMATRVPKPLLHELATTTLWMLPWALLFSSGVEDFGTFAQRPSVFWVGIVVVLVLLYYLEHYATDFMLTKV